MKDKYQAYFFLLLWGIWLNGGGLLCTLHQSPGLHFYPFYTELLSYAVHFTELKKIYIYVPL